MPVPRSWSKIGWGLSRVASHRSNQWLRSKSSICPKGHSGCFRADGYDFFWFDMDCGAGVESNHGEPKLLREADNWLRWPCWQLGFGVLTSLLLQLGLRLGSGFECYSLLSSLLALALMESNSHMLSVYKNPSHCLGQGRNPDFFVQSTSNSQGFKQWFKKSVDPLLNCVDHNLSR